MTTKVVTFDKSTTHLDRDQCCVLKLQDHVQTTANAWCHACHKKSAHVTRHAIFVDKCKRRIPWFVSRKYRSIASGNAERYEEDLECSEFSSNIHGPFMLNFVKALGDGLPPSHTIRQMEFPTFVSDALLHKQTTKSDVQHKSQSIQTDYRESETQTDPFSPDYMVTGKTEPEILTLTSLAWERGLPVGKDEIYMIQRAREKRRLEAMLPPLSREHLTQRLKMIAKIECREWVYRETQIEDLQRLRMEMLKKMVENQNEEFQTTAAERVWIVAKNQRRAQKKFLNTLAFRHFLEMRKIMVKKQRAQKQLQRAKGREPSDTEVTLLRTGRIPMHCTQVKKIQCKYLETYSDLIALEESLPKSKFNLQLKLPKLAVLPKTGYVKRKDKLQKELQEAYDAIIAEKVMGQSRKDQSAVTSLMEKLEKPPPRPITPEIRDSPETEDLMTMATICLQKILRGRAVHIMMHDGKERREDLIRELRTSSALSDTHQIIIQVAQLKLQEELSHRAQKQTQNEELDVIMETVAGNEIGTLLDFLNKELIRLHDERRIHAMALLAERQRRLREAQESGLRQVEERRRREEDEIYRQMLHIHEKTIEVYLKNVLTTGIQQASRRQAHKEISALAQKISNAAHEFESKQTEIESEELVAELVHTFLLPEVQKKLARENVGKKQQAALMAAYDVIYSQLQLPRSPPVEEVKERLEMMSEEFSTLSSSEAIDEEMGSSWHARESLETWFPVDPFANMWFEHPDDISIAETVEEEESMDEENGHKKSFKSETEGESEFARSSESVSALSSGGHLK